MPHSLSRRTALLAGASSLLLALQRPKVVAAAIWVEFHPSSAAPGATVEIRGYRFPSSSSLGVFLVPECEADEVTSLEDSRVVPVGEVAADDRGQGVAILMVPHLPAGRYVGLIHCEQCAARSSARTVVPGERFRVMPPLWPYPV